MTNPQNITEEEVLRGARALAECYFLDGSVQDLEQFGESNRQRFMAQSRAVLEAARKEQK